jgi:hypothetical protein
VRTAFIIKFLQIKVALFNLWLISSLLLASLSPFLMCYYAYQMNEYLGEEKPLKSILSGHPE